MIRLKIRLSIFALIAVAACAAQAPSFNSEVISAGSLVLLGIVKVLVAGSESPYGPTTHRARSYEPSTNSWTTPTGARLKGGSQTATALPNGQVLGVGT